MSSLSKPLTIVRALIPHSPTVTITSSVSTLWWTLDEFTGEFLGLDNSQLKWFECASTLRCLFAMGMSGGDLSCFQVSEEAL